MHSPRLDAPNGPWLGCLVNGASGLMDPANSFPVPDQDKSGTTLVCTRRAAGHIEGGKKVHAGDMLSDTRHAGCDAYVRATD